MTAAVCNQQLIVIGAVVYNSYGARLFMAQRPLCISKYAKEKRTEHNLFVKRNGKSEAKVTNNRRLRLTYFTIKANY